MSDTPSPRPGEPAIQPEVIEFAGGTYTLTKPFRWVDQERGITEGPLYAKEGDPGHLYLPDAGYLHAGQPLFRMHRILMPAGAV